jgi:hypothetical protein
MGYLHDFRAKLEDMLGKLPPEARADVISFVTEKVYESYKNGRAAGSSTEEERETTAPKVKGRRPYKR